MARKVADCRKYPSESGCTLTLVGEEEEVLRAAVEHAVSVHEHEDTPQLREQIRGLLEDEHATGPDGMNFVQLIEFKTGKRDQLDELLDEWEAVTGGKCTATRAVLTQEHEKPGSYYEFVEFPSYDEAMRNSRLPETDALSRKMRDLCDEEPTFHNLDVVRAETL
ncbi:DUF1059 domain-containing protein [Saccharopolyspora hirsuta]|uniref:DUF1059 domain-containing protein n=1 Tax=Saccharopolyspora hirsuta TaxID=1837 RepID=A0A5M7C6N2_SACHI|nr:DUF1059 domain-containing protein [Saccharopolyspora hirsuta]KAA5835948.1 DUF1059 domain-containing protein [Saccharopolyspora hirsuta]